MSRRHAFTLLEMVLSLAISSVLAVAVTSAIYIVTHSMPGYGDAMSTSSDLIAVDDVVRTELELASRIVQADSNSVEFDVPDRDGDDIDERIEIAWSGTQGDPVLQRVNAGTWQPLMQTVRRMQFSTSGATEPVFDGTFTPVVSAGSIDGRFTNGGWSPLYPNNRRGFEIDPTVPSGHKWRLTSVDLYLQWDAGKAGEVLEISAGRDVSSVTHAWKHSVVEYTGGDIAAGGEWVNVPLRTPWLDRTEDVIVQVYNKVGSTSPYLRLKSLSSMPVGVTLLLDISGSWVLTPLVAVAIEVHYETMSTDDAETDTPTIESMTLEFGFDPGVSDATLRMRPVAQVEDNR